MSVFACWVGVRGGARVYVCGKVCSCVSGCVGVFVRECVSVCLSEWVDE